MILKLCSCQTTFLQLTGQSFIIFCAAGVCAEEMGVSACSLAYGNNFRSCLTITQLSRRNSLLIAPNSSILNKPCPGQNSQKQIRSTDTASQITVDIPRSTRLQKGRTNNRSSWNYIVLVCWVFLKKFWLRARSVILYSCHMLLWHRMINFKLKKDKP